MIKLTLTSGRPLYLAAGEVACVFEPAEGNSRVGLRHVGPGDSGAFIVKETPAEVDALVDEALGENMWVGKPARNEAPAGEEPSGTDGDQYGSSLMVVEDGACLDLHLLILHPNTVAIAADGLTAFALVRRGKGGPPVIVRFTFGRPHDVATSAFDGWDSATGA